MATAKWNKNQALADAQAAATSFDSASVTFDSSAVYFDGFNPTGLTEEGETGATWEKETE